MGAGEGGGVPSRLPFGPTAGGFAYTNGEKSAFNLREFVRTSRHPDHGRAWKVGSEPQFMTPLPADNRDNRDPGICPVLSVLGTNNSKN